MKKVLIASISVLAALAAGFSIIAARFESTVVPNTFVRTINVGGLTKDEAAKRIRIWWEAERIKKLALTNSLFVKPLPPMTPTELGLSVDDAAVVAELPMTDLVQAISSKVGAGAADQKKFDVKFKTNPALLTDLKKRIREAVGKNRPARVIFEKGAIVRQPEVGGFELDDQQLTEAVVAGLDSETVQVPLHEAPKTIPDEELNKITDVVSEYSTTFPSYQSSRNTNIRLAAAKLNGTVLLPGQEISFNDTVGRRTAKGGFREAPVLKNGKHDHDIGGGICQVSTTMYNAALLADMKIVRRNNHSIPSVYVPVGRDATVDWGTLDLVWANPTDQPVANERKRKPGLYRAHVADREIGIVSIEVASLCR